MVDDRKGKTFIMVLTNGDLPTNPMSLRECLVCGGIFTREESQHHHGVPCQPTPHRSLATIAGRG